MRHLILLCLALSAAPAIAQGDPSNPAGAPLTPSQDTVNQPTRPPVPTATTPNKARETAERAGPLTGDDADAANAQADLDADAPAKPIAPNRRLDKRERRAAPR